MKVYIDGDELSSVELRRKLNEYPSYQQTLTADYKENILAGSTPVSVSKPFA